MTNRRERFSFPGAFGDQLDARLDLPRGEPSAYALFAHCFTCSKDVAAASAISSNLVERGVAVLRFDFTGLGASDGEFANTDFSSNIDDLVAAADMLRTRHRAPSLLIGHSLGGAAILAAVERIPEAQAVVTIGAPFDPAHVTELFSEEAIATMHAVGEAEVELAGRRFTVRRQLLDDLGSHQMEAAVAGLGRPLLVLHSPVDNVVDVDNARRIFDAAKHPKSFVSLDTADHLLTNRSDGEYAAVVVAAWASRYLPAAEDDADDADDGPPVDPGIELGTGVLVSESDVGSFSQDITVRGHRLVADEPIGIGDDTGPSPYDLVLAGLGACTSMTLRMYAERHAIPLEHVSVVLEHERTYATDCRDAGVQRCRVDHISRTLRLDGPALTDEQRSTLMQIADKCPVHRTLQGDIRIDTTLVSAAPESRS